jgi:hypothetical protein
VRITLRVTFRGNLPNLNDATTMPAPSREQYHEEVKSNRREDHAEYDWVPGDIKVCEHVGSIVHSKEGELNRSDFCEQLFG